MSQNSLPKIITDSEEKGIEESFGGINFFLFLVVY